MKGKVAFMDFIDYEVVADAPGKALLAGGYSVLEPGNHGFVTTLSPKVRVYAHLNSTKEVEIRVPMFDMEVHGGVLRDGTFDFAVPAQLNLVKTAAELASRYVSTLGYTPYGFNLLTENDNQFAYRLGNGPDSKVSKSGLGSSAAVTVATVSAVLAAMGFDMDNGNRWGQEIHNIAQLAHAIATEKVGSGFDIAAATFGSGIYTRYSPSIVKSLPNQFTNYELAEKVSSRWDWTMQQTTVPTKFEILFANFIGNGAITVNMVKEVNKFKERDPDSYFGIINNIEAATVSTINAFEAMNKGDSVEDNMKALKRSIDEGRKFSKELGVRSGVDIESDVNTKLIEDTNAHGAALTKLPGAGGNDAILALFTDVARKEAVKSFWLENNSLDVIKLDLYNKGVKVRNGNLVKTPVLTH